MKIEQDTKLDFGDVLIRPKRTTMSSRSEVDLEREITFPHSTLTWKGIPLIAANMDTIGTYDVYNVLSKHKIITAFHKFYNAEDFIAMQGFGLDPNYFMVSSGIFKALLSDLAVSGELAMLINSQYWFFLYK